MKRYLKFLIVIVLTISVLSGCYLLPQEEDPLEPPLLKPAQVEYVTEVIELSDIKKESIIRGKFRSENEITLSFEKISGILIQKHIKPGDRVKKGDLLFELDIDDMEHNEQIAYYNYKKAKYRYDGLRSNNASYYDIKAADMDKEIALLNYEKIQQEIEKSKIHAPMDGFVTYMTNANIGDYVSGDKIIVRIADESALRLIVNGDDAYKFDFGDIVDIEVNIKRQKFNYKGEIVLSPFDKPENMEEDFDEPTTIISITNLNNPAIKINQGAIITLIEQSAEDVIVIHRNRIKNYFGRTFVYVFEDGIKVERDVEKGITSTTMVEIREGLEVGDIIIIR